MGDPPPPRSPRAQHVIKRISQTCKSAQCDLKLRLKNDSHYVVALALRKVNFVSRNQLASNKSPLGRIASFAFSFVLDYILAWIWNAKRQNFHHIFKNAMKLNVLNYGSVADRCMRRRDLLKRWNFKLKNHGTKEKLLAARYRDAPSRTCKLCMFFITPQFDFFWT